MSTPVDESIRTVTTAGHQSLIRWDPAPPAYSGALAASRQWVTAGSVDDAKMHGAAGR